MSDAVDPAHEGLPAPRENIEVVGHGALTDAVERAWRSGRMGHAMLLVGPRGIGKATFAYAVAALVVSREATIAEAQASVARQQIANGAAQGFRRLSVAVSKEGKLKREIGVDQVRALEPFLRQRLGASEWRVVLVDAVDDLNAASANALLKILEEPGERTLFLLIAHRQGAILPTIRSRCAVRRVDPLSQAEVTSVLARSTVEPGRIEQAARRGGGSVRRAIAFAQGNVLEAIDRIDRLFERPEWSATDAQRVVDLAAGRGSEMVGDEVVAYLPDALRDYAAARGREGATSSAARLAGTAQALEADLAARDEYGVDRALSLRAALSTAHGALQERVVKPGGTG